MRIFLTGASGFVGGAFVKTFARTHDITAMSRSDKSDAAIRALGATPVRAALGEVKTERLKAWVSSSRPKPTSPKKRRAPAR